jgi:hypothetical protein
LANVVFSHGLVALIDIMRAGSEFIIAVVREVGYAG